MEKPAAHTTMPMIANHPIDRRSIPVMIASAAASVSNTHRPCNVQVMKNRNGSVLI